MPHPNFKLSPLQRFLLKCEHNPVTGCVNWTGAQTMGRGKRRPYGKFHFNRRKVYAHRWAAQHILGIDLRPEQHVDHMCGNTLCQLHLQACDPLTNVALYWLRVEVGMEPEPEDDFGIHAGVPYYAPPAWLIGAINHRAPDPQPFIKHDFS